MGVAASATPLFLGLARRRRRAKVEVLEVLAEVEARLPFLVDLGVWRGNELYVRALDGGAAELDLMDRREDIALRDRHRA